MRKNPGPTGGTLVNAEAVVLLAEITDPELIHEDDAKLSAY
jgi:hypothetical protein